MIFERRWEDGKQVSIYLPDVVAQQLFELATQECRRPNDQARYLLFRAIDERWYPQLSQPIQDDTTKVALSAKPDHVQV